MSSAGQTGQRGQRCPRLRVRLALIGVMALPLGSCGPFGAGLAELPSDQGWRPLPVANWIIDDAIRPRTVVFCPAAACPAPAMVAVFEAQGDEATRLEQLITGDPARMLRNLSQPPGGRPKAAAKSDKPAGPGSVTTVERLADVGISGARVTIRSKVTDGRMAIGVVLTQRRGNALAIALAVTTDPQTALAYARAGLSSMR